MAFASCRKRFSLTCHFTLGLTAWVVAISSLPLAAFTVLADEPAQSINEKELLRLQSIWKGQLSEIATCHLRFRFVSSGSVAPISSEEFERVIDSAGIARNHDALTEIVKHLLSGPIPWKVPWASCEFWMKGKNSRFESSTDGKLTEDVALRDDTETEVSPPNNQVTVFRRDASGVGRVSFAEFRELPDSEAIWSVKRSEPEALELVTTDGQARMTVDKATGIVKGLAYLDEHGNITRLILQRDIRTYADGINFPNVHILGAFTSGRLNMARIIVLDSAEFNIDVPETKFAVSIKKGTKLLDARHDRSAIQYIESDRAAPDAITVLDEKERAREEEKAESSTWRWLGIIVTGAVAIGAARFAWVRLSRVGR